MKKLRGVSNSAHIDFTDYVTISDDDLYEEICDSYEPPEPDYY